MSNLYQNKSQNIFKTWLLMGGFFVMVTAVGFVLAQYFGSPVYLYAAVGISLFMNIASYWFADKMVIKMAGAKAIEKKEDYPELWNIVENLSITAGLPMPKLYIIEDPAPSAFATGRNPNHSAIAVTTGILPLLTRAELEGVIAHELSHIGNRDMLVATVVVVLAGVISILADVALRASMFGGGNSENRNPITIVFGVMAIFLAPLAATIMKLAVTRQREFLADASGALLTRYPEGLASALQKIEKFAQPMQRVSTATAHLYISNPLQRDSDSDESQDEPRKVSWIAKLFMTHPPTHERVAALMENK
jgi:heat shock protein HtpX